MLLVSVVVIQALHITVSKAAGMNTWLTPGGCEVVTNTFSISPLGKRVGRKRSFRLCYFENHV